MNQIVDQQIKEETFSMPQNKSHLTITQPINSRIPHRCAHVVATFFLALSIVPVAWGQQRDVEKFPSRPIQIIVPATPGGILDISARLIANGMSRELGQSVVVDYKAGAGQTIGANFVAKSVADGHTLLLGSNVSLAVNPQMMSNIPYDAQKDLTPVAILGSNANAIMVLPSFPAKTFQEFLDYVRAHPGKVSYAHPNPGSSAHIAAEALRQQAKLDYLAVPFKGSAGATTAALGGQVDVLVDNMATALPLIKSGRLKALAVTSAKRSAFMPDVPSIAEMGFPGFNIAGWISIHAPAATSTPIISRLNAAIQRALASPEVQQQFERASIDPINLKTQELASYLKADYERWGSVIRMGNIQPE